MGSLPREYQYVIICNNMYVKSAAGFEDESIYIGHWVEMRERERERE